MASSNNSIERYKLHTTFYPQYLVHRTPDDGDSENSPETRWTLGEKIGAGGFGAVLRQESNRGQLRAVKKLYHDLLVSKKIDIFRELNTLAKLKDVGISRSGSMQILIND